MKLACSSGAFTATIHQVSPPSSTEGLLFVHRGRSDPLLLLWLMFLEMSSLLLGVSECHWDVSSYQVVFENLYLAE